MKKLLLFVLFLLAGVSGQNQETIAILDFQSNSPVTPGQAKYVADNLRKQFNAGGKFIVLDKWIIDTVLAEQGFNSARACASEQCLIAMGHLLTVNKVLGGSIVKKGENVELSAIMIDVDANTLVNSSTVTIPAAHRKISDQDISALFRSLVINPTTNKNAAASGSKSKGSSTKEDVSITPQKETSHGTSVFKKTGFWLTTSACVVGVAAVSAYYFLRGSKGPGSAPDTGISLGDAPSHSK